MDNFRPGRFVAGDQQTVIIGLSRLIARGTVESCHVSARFANNQIAGCMIPGFQTAVMGEVKIATGQGDIFDPPAPQIDQITKTVGDRLIAANSIAEKSRLLPYGRRRCCLHG